MQEEENICRIELLWVLFVHVLFLHEVDMEIKTVWYISLKLNI